MPNCPRLQPPPAQRLLPPAITASRRTQPPRQQVELGSIYTPMSQGALRFPSSRRPASCWARVPADVDPRFLQELLYDDWALPKPNALISITGATKDSELGSMPLHEELELRQGLVRVVHATGAWLASEAIGARGANALLSRVLQDDPEVVCIGVSPWKSVDQREALARAAGHHVCAYHAAEATGGLSPSVSHFVLSDEGDPGKSLEGNASALRSAIENVLCLPPSKQLDVREPGPLRSYSERSAVPDGYRSARATDAGCPRLLVVVGGGVATLQAVLSAVKRKTPVLVLPSTGHAAADVAAVCAAKDGDPLPASLFRDASSRPDSSYREKAPDLLRQIAQHGRARLGAARQPAISVFRASGGGAGTNELAQALMRALLCAYSSPVDAVNCAVSWQDASSLRWQLGQPTVAADAAGFAAAFERALLLKSTDCIEVMVGARAPVHLVRLDVLADDLTFRRTTATATASLPIARAAVAEYRSAGKLALSTSKADLRRLARCAGSAWGYALLQAVLDGHDEYTSTLRMRWHGALVAEEGGDEPAEGLVGERARLVPVWFDLMMWAVLVAEPQIARALWHRVEQPLRAALLASRVAREAAGRSSGLLASKLRRDADEYERWAIGLLDTADSTEAHLLLLATDAEYMGSQRSCLEMASDSGALRCSAFCAHPAVYETLTTTFDGFILPIPRHFRLPVQGTVAGVIQSSDQHELQCLYGSGAAEVRSWCRQIELAKAEEMGGPVRLYRNMQPASAISAALHVFRVPKVKYALHATSRLAYLITLAVTLCSLPLTNHASNDKGLAPDELLALEWAVWAWTFTLVLEQAKHMLRVGVERVSRTGRLSNLFTYADDAGQLREFTGSSMILLAGALRLVTYYVRRQHPTHTAPQRSSTTTQRLTCHPPLAHPPTRSAHPGAPPSLRPGLTAPQPHCTPASLRPSLTHAHAPISSRHTARLRARERRHAPALGPDPLLPRHPPRDGALRRRAPGFAAPWPLPMDSQGDGLRGRPLATCRHPCARGPRHRAHRPPARHCEEWRRGLAPAGPHAALGDARRL